ncbi:hypothetical protein [uncultured Brachyspira sp.]|uniref:hypothetical protein n=1 Tax=uncultured Brachyspira sp. TaxID=221953 RepID=UPI002639814D|nr:hypothetical protein [uncultured Brachyspira sp.]
MKKVSKIALVLMTLALLSTACSKVRTTNLIGTYKSGTATMTVSSDGDVSFNIPSNATGVLASLAKITTSKYDSTGQEYRPNALVPWDLTTEKQSYDYEVKLFFEEEIVDNSSGYPITTRVYHDATLKYKFTKDKETVKCELNVTVPQGKGDSGTVTFSK